MDPYWTDPAAPDAPLPDATPVPFYEDVMSEAAPAPTPEWTPAPDEAPLAVPPPGEPIGVDEAAALFSPENQRATLARYGWSPPAAAWAGGVPVNFTSDPTAGGAYYADQSGGPGRVMMSTAFRDPDWLGYAFEHEMHHAHDAAGPTGAFNPEAPGAIPRPQADFERMAADQQYPFAARIGQQILAEQRAAGGLSLPTSWRPRFAQLDPAHLNHDLIAGLDYDYGAVPPAYGQRYFGYADRGPAPITAGLVAGTERRFR